MGNYRKSWNQRCDNERKEYISKRMLTNTIIANCGEWNVGKTGSILLLYAKLRKAAGMDMPDGLVNKNEDICEVVTINGIRVGVSSFGDTKQTVKEHLDELRDKDCQIIVTACRNNNAMIRLLKDCARGYRLIRSSNARICEETTNSRIAPKGICDRFNEQWAEEMANLIESWCYV